MAAVLSLGFLIGLRHALEADHVAAVASLGCRATSLREGLRLGAAWGLGHSLTLFLLGSAVLALGGALPARVSGLLEFCAGGMLVLLGGSLVRGILRGKQNAPRVNVAGGAPEARAGAARALAVGMVHGLAGSGALILLTLHSVPSIGWGFLYILLFGAGSMLGMALLSTALVVPLRWARFQPVRMGSGLQIGIGLITAGLGVNLMVGNEWVAAFFFY